MMTIKVDLNNPDMAAIRSAADALRRGELVIYPTETVYGLAADASNEQAIKAVYDAKGRLDNHPLPVQVGCVEDVFKAVEYMSSDARRLAELYWPGPLTMVLAKGANLPALVTGGGNTVGVRIPDHLVALALLKEFGGPIIATSANASGNPAPTTADDAIREVGESVSVVLDSGRSRFGVASTVVDMTTTPPKVLRQGSISLQQIRKVLGQIE